MEIRIRNLSKNYFSEGKTIAALDRVDLTIPADRIFTLLGPSGCGKSTLLRTIAGFLIPDEGTVYLNPEMRARIVFAPDQNFKIVESPSL